MGVLTNLPLLGSFVIFCIGWLMSLISYIVYRSKEGKYIYKSDNNWNWWLLINGLLAGVLTFFIIEKNPKGYRVAWSIYLGMCFQWAFGIFRGYVYSNINSAIAYGVGNLLLLIVFLIWILYFGCDGNTAVGSIINKEGGSSSNSNNADA